MSNEASEFLTGEEENMLHHLVNKSLGLAEGWFYHEHLGTLLTIAVGMTIDDGLLAQVEALADEVTAFEEREEH